jgi:hypothetical protein
MHPVINSNDGTFGDKGNAMIGDAVVPERRRQKVKKVKKRGHEFTSKVEIGVAVRDTAASGLSLRKCLASDTFKFGFD